MTLQMVYATLVVAIAAEVVATTALGRSDGFTRPVPSLITVVGYAVASYFLSLTLRVMPTGVVYAVWSGMGIVFISRDRLVLVRREAGLARTDRPRTHHCGRDGR